MDLAALLQLPPGSLIVALLLLTRLSALFVMAPVFGNAVVPVRVRVALAGLLTFLLLPIELAAKPLVLEGAGVLALAVARELAVGLTLGFISMMFFHGIQFAGQQLSAQIGFAMPSMFDPTTRAQSSPIGTMLTLLATVAFLSLNVHHYLLIAIWRSLRAIPLGTFTPSGETIARVLQATTGVFDVALTLLLPMLGVLLILEIVLAILNRVMPQFNLFSVSAGIKILVGLGSLWITLPLMGGTMDLLLDRMARQLLEFF